MSATVRFVVVCLLLHAALVVGKTILEIGDVERVSQLIRPAIRVVLVIWCIYGLVCQEKWAWWVTVLAGGIYGLVGLVTWTVLGAAGQIGEVSLGYGAFFILLSASLLAAAVALLTKGARSEILGTSGR